MSKTIKWLIAGIAIGLLIVVMWEFHVWVKQQRISQLNRVEQASQQQIAAYKHRADSLRVLIGQMDFVQAELMDSIDVLIDSIRVLQKQKQQAAGKVQTLTAYDLASLVETLVPGGGYVLIELRPDTVAVIPIEMFRAIAGMLVEHGFLVDENKLLARTLAMQDSAMRQLRAINQQQGVLISTQDSTITLQQRTITSYAFQYAEREAYWQRKVNGIYIIGGVIVLTLMALVN